MASEYASIDAPTSKRPSSLRTVLIAVVLAFLAGLAAMGFALREWGGMGIFDPTPVPAATAQPSLAPTLALAPDARVIPLDPGSADQLAARVRDLEERLSRISVSAQAASGNAARAEGLLIAFAARRALDRGVALGYLEAQLRDRFGPAQPRAVAVVLAASRTPTTLERLQSDFAELAPGLATRGATANWWQGLQRELAELVIVRRTGTPSPASAERLERARRDLEGGHVERALAEVARMPGRAKAEPWIADARRYIEARRALDIIETAAIIEPRAAAALPLPAPPMPS